MGNIYYVQPSGNDAASGGSLNPFKSPQKGVSILKPGDTLNVRQGTYSEGFLCGWDPSGDYAPISGQPGAPITIQADPSAPVGSVKLPSRNNKTEDVINFEPANGPQNYIIVKGFALPCDKSVVDHAIRVGGSTKFGNVGVQLLNNVVSNAGAFGIFSSFTTDLLLQGNQVSGTKGSNSTGHGVYFSNSAVRPVARGNILFGNGSEGIHLNGDASQGGSGVILNAILENNIIYNNAANGINGDGVPGAIIQNNLICGNTKHGICLYRIDAALDSTNCLIVNNSIVGPSSAGAAIQLVNASTGAIIFNNVLIGGAYGALNIFNASLPGLLSDYNATCDLFCSDDTGKHSTLAQWKASGHDLHSFVATALQLFAPGTYLLKSGSPAINVGVTNLGGKSAPPFDAMGSPRIGAVDLGAYEAKPTLAGDVDGSGRVDIVDLTIVANNWGKRNMGYTGGDLNADGVTDIQDFTMVVNHWQEHI